MEDRELDENGIPKVPRHYNMQCEAGVFQSGEQIHVSFEHKRVIYPAFGTAATEEPSDGQCI